MPKKINFEKINKDFLSMLEIYELKPISFGISITLSSDDFDAIAAVHPDLVHHPRIILFLGPVGDDLQWSIQILRQLNIDNL